MVVFFFLGTMNIRLRLDQLHRLIDVFFHARLLQFMLFDLRVRLLIEEGELLALYLSPPLDVHTPHFQPCQELIFLDLISIEELPVFLGCDHFFSLLIEELLFFSFLPLRESEVMFEGSFELGAQVEFTLFRLFCVERAYLMERNVIQELLHLLGGPEVPVPLLLTQHKLVLLLLLYLLKQVILLHRMGKDSGVGF